jgi:DNA-binding HxlR family transcriptional regulator
MSDMTEGETPYCYEFRQAMDVVGSRWSGEILRVLLAGTGRFSQISAAIPGLSDRLLSERLKRFESEGIVKREVDPGPPVRVSYSLTPKGADLVDAFGALSDWAEKWIGDSADPVPSAR